MLRIIFHDDEKVNQKIQKWVGIFTIVAFLFYGVTWFTGVYDPWNTTHEEAQEFDRISMEQHVQAVDNTPYAMQNDVNHIGNMMVDEQVCDAEIEIDQYEEMEAEGTASAMDTLNKERLEEFVSKAKRKYVDDGHDHDGCD